MPLHLDAFIPENKHTEYLASILSGVNSGKSIYLSKERKILHIRKVLTDSIVGDVFGNVIYTLKINEDNLGLIDTDIVLDNPVATNLNLLEKLPDSSEANEYYNAEIGDQNGRLQIETVNRNAIKEDIEGTEQSAFLSAFPFVVNIYNDMSEINEKYGFKENVRVGQTDLTVSGFSDRFIAPATLFHTDETFTWFFGKVIKIRMVRCDDFGESLSFLIVDVESGMGLIPMAMSYDCFDLSSLAVGKIIEARADIKADLGIMPPDA